MALALVVWLGSPFLCTGAVSVHAAPTEPVSLLVEGPTVREASGSAGVLSVSVGAPRLAEIGDRVAPISKTTRVRRNIAHATFCLPQNILGITYYALLKLAGGVVSVAQLREVTIIVTRTPFGASLGKYIFVNESILIEGTIAHEYGHTLQGYTHGPFYLLLEGLTSFVQAAISLVSPSFAAPYFDRWPENEASQLGGVALAGSRLSSPSSTELDEE